MRTHSAPKPCRVCTKPVTHGLSTRLHPWCKPRKVVKPERPALPPYRLIREVSQEGQTRPSMDIAKGNHRDRGLLDLAHEIKECTNCGKHVEHGCEPAHENSIEAGKGGAIKSHDHRHAALCHDCHAWLDQGGKRSPCGQWSVGQKAFMFDRAHKRTFDEYWKRGWLKVCA